MILFINNDNTKEKEEKFYNIYNTYYRYTYTIAMNVLKHNSEETEDIVQEVFTNVWKTLDVITDDTSAKAWIATIARNTAINFLKKKVSRNSKTLDIEDDIMYAVIGGEENDPADLVATAESVEKIYEEISNMDKKYADVLLLSFKFHMTPEKIAEVLQRKPKTVYTQLSRGKQILKEKLLSKEEVKQK